MIPKAGELLKKLAALTDAPVAPGTRSKSLKEKITESLALALEQAGGDKGSTKPLTEWKNSFTKKDEEKKTVLRDAARLRKNFDLVQIYEAYLQKLRERGLFDYDDMLLDVIRELENSPDLRYTLQEKFLYILVDEFQDTNGAQMRLLDLLLDSELSEGRPNIMAVGDDDQSIYKFQGANVENILGFSGKFVDPKIVVLTDNYRSTQEILDFARTVVLRGEDRLESRLENIRKDLKASRQHLPKGMLLQKDFETSYEELFWMAKEIKRILDEKRCDPGEIAVLAPKHKILEAAAKTLNYFGIPVAYERQQNLLEDPLIHEIVTILEYVDSMVRNDRDQADHLLPEILSFKFWGINRVTLWKISVAASRSRKKNWLDIMVDSESASLRNIAKFLMELAADAKSKTVEEIIDLITGIEATDIADDTYGDDDQSVLRFEDNVPYRSPFKSFYFSEERLTDPASGYFEYLENLQAFIAKIRQYKAAKVLSSGDVIKFVKLLDNNKLPLNHTLQLSTNDDAVQLMTVHKAKGQEFDSVFVLNCQDKAWVRRRGDKLQFPSNLPLSAENETPDDVLRLFYVAITRAKHFLYLTRHRFDDKGRELIHLRFLSGADEQAQGSGKSRESIDMEAAKSRAAKEYGAEKFFQLIDDVRRHEPHSEDEKHLLKATLQNYRLSVTHLKNFIDVAKAGPQVFLERNLLRFPQMITPSLAFGNAMHKALANFYLVYKREGSLPALDFLLKNFEETLALQRLNDNDFRKQLGRGREDLTCFYQNRSALIDPQDKVEVNFRSQQVVVEDVPISGAIDRIHAVPSSSEIVVFDYKTGKTFDRWEPSDEYLQYKAWDYKMQLQFYKILAEHSREYRGKVVRKGVLDFLKPRDGKIMSLELEIADEDVERLKKLIAVVYRKIVALDFPDVSTYDKDLFGIGHFTEDLIAGRV